MTSEIPDRTPADAHVNETAWLPVFTHDYTTICVRRDGDSLLVWSHIMENDLADERDEVRRYVLTTPPPTGPWTDAQVEVASDALIQSIIENRWVIAYDPDEDGTPDNDRIDRREAEYAARVVLDAVARVPVAGPVPVVTEAMVTAAMNAPFVPAESGLTFRRANIRSMIEAALAVAAGGSDDDQ